MKNTISSEAPEQLSFMESAMFSLQKIVLLNAKLLCIGVALSTALGAAVGRWLPASYGSYFILKTDPSVLSLAQSSTVLDAVIKAQGIVTSDSLEETREKLLKRIKISYSHGDKLLTVQARGPSPEAAEALSKELLKQIFAESKPKGMEQQLLETQYQQAATIEKAATEIMQQQNTDVKRQKAASGNDFTAGFAQLLTVITNAQKMQLEATMKGRGIDSSDAIQMPTYSTRPVSPGPLIMAAAMGLIAGLLLLVFVVARHGLQQRAQASSNLQ